MKKETVYAFLGKKEQEVRKLKDKQLQQSLLRAISQCRRWVEQPWAEMSEPVNRQIEEMEQEASALAEKQKQQPLIEAEQARQTELYMLYTTIYQPFQQKILPSVRNAQLERKDQARQKAERAQRASKGKNT